VGFFLNTFFVRCSGFVLKIDFHPSPHALFGPDIFSGRSAEFTWSVREKSGKLFGTVLMQGQGWVCFFCWAKAASVSKYIELKVGEWGRK